MFLRKRKFFDKDGNFNPELFLNLIKKASKKIKKSNQKKRLNFFSFGGFFVSQKDIWKFISKLSGFLLSGMDLKTSLSIVSKQIDNKKLSGIVSEMRSNIDFGVVISDTMRQYPRVFDNLIISLVAIGEKTGKLGFVLQKIEQKMLEQIELKSKVRGALLYPVILLFLTILSVMVIMTIVIPRISEVFEKTGAELPLLTQIVIGISDFLKERWYVIIIGILLFIFFIIFFKRTLIGELIFGVIGIKIPIFSFIIKRSNVIYFSNAFSLLLDSGILMVEAIETAGKSLPNIYYRREIVRIKRELESGVTFSKSLGLDADSGVYLNKLFDEEFAYIVNMGEQTGTLSKTISKLRENYNFELRRYIGNLSTMLEPIVLVLIGILVGIIVTAIMLPFFNFGKTIK